MSNEQPQEAQAPAPPTLKLVSWCNIHNYALSMHSDVGSLIHLTLGGDDCKTLCGKKYPKRRDSRGNPAGFRYCKRCCRAAYKMGYEPGFAKNLGIAE